MLRVIADHPAPADEPHSPFAVPQSMNPFRGEIFRRQSQSVADGCSEQHTSKRL
jgi:hypothetical protein